MTISVSFIRLFFMTLSTLLSAAYCATEALFGSPIVSVLIGGGIGAAFGFMLIFVDKVVKRFNLRAFNIALFGLFLGYLMGQAVIVVVDTALRPPAEVAHILNIAILLFCTYLSMVMTARASESLYVSIPFVKLTPTTNKKKDILIAKSILMDARIIDLAASGLLDHQLIIPRFIVNELYEMHDDADEGIRSKARRSLEVLKKLEGMSSLRLRYSDVDVPDVKDPVEKMVRLARILDANFLTAHISRVQQSSVEGVIIINIHSLANALKPIMQTGETMPIKIQRYGKEPRQGVGYLSDGTMVVVNGGGGFIGETIDVQVLSVKHTSSGRMIFCNATERIDGEGSALHDTKEKAHAGASTAHRDYFLV